MYGSQPILATQHLPSRFFSPDSRFESTPVQCKLARQVMMLQITLSSVSNILPCVPCGALSSTDHSPMRVMFLCKQYPVRRLAAYRGCCGSSTAKTKIGSRQRRHTARRTQGFSQMQRGAVVLAFSEETREYLRIPPRTARGYTSFARGEGLHAQARVRVESLIGELGRADVHDMELGTMALQLGEPSYEPRHIPLVTSVSR
jgi:hypothetical protein